ncbi:MAG: DUF3829 domain-containing protein [Lachnospiraceae bacterium]|nr:DUF3829 domain-containing protein [Lachnospiraceae bacterium]
MKKKITTILLTICLLLLAMGCSDSSRAESDSNKKETANSTAKEPQSEVKETEEEEETQPDVNPETMERIKYNTYVELNNYMVEVLENLDNYYLVVEYADEFAFVPDSNLPYKHNIYSLNPEIIDEALAMVEMEPEFPEMDELVVEIAEPMRNLMEAFSLISDSYDFSENQYAKAKEYHASIQANVDQFEELAYLFMDELEIIATERVLAAEQEMLDDGLHIIYNSSHAITVVEQILNECYAQGIYDDNIIELDLTNIRPLYEELVTTAENYEKAVNDPNQLMLESLAGDPINSMKSLVQSVEWMIKIVDEQRPISDPGSEALGGIIHIEEVLSRCIDQYNSSFAE